MRDFHRLVPQDEFGAEIMGSGLQGNQKLEKEIRNWKSEIRSWMKPKLSQ